MASDVEKIQRAQTLRNSGYTIKEVQKILKAEFDSELDSHFFKTFSRPETNIEKYDNRHYRSVSDSVIEEYVDIGKKLLHQNFGIGKIELYQHNNTLLMKIRLKKWSSDIDIIGQKIINSLGKDYMNFYYEIIFNHEVFKNNINDNCAAIIHFDLIWEGGK
jgi:DNA-binding transcriptional MerR regulator